MGLHKARQASLTGAIVAGFWHQRGDRLIVQRFGGGEHDVPAEAKRGPNGTILIGREMLVPMQQPR